MSISRIISQYYIGILIWRDDWTLFVRGIHGETLTLSNMKASSRGRELYSMLSAITGIPNTMMRLMRGKTILKPHVSLLESGLENGCTIDLYTPGCGGGKGSYNNNFTFWY